MIGIDLSGKIALVTGASRRIGIGAAIARTLAQAGADVFITYYTPYDNEMPWGVQDAEPQETLAELRELGVRAEGAEADLSDPSLPARLFDQAEATLGPVDILVNNATYSVNATIGELTADLLDRHYAINVRGAALMCREFAIRHDGRPGGRMINMVSGELAGPMPGEIPYITTKGAVDALTITLSAELAGKGITVNAVNPGATDTGWMPPDLYEQLRKQTPLGRIGQPQDAANLILFLASEQGAWITGEIINSRGGLR